MNFLELINKCLLELNYRPVNSLSELTKNDHKRIISILNIINKEVCGNEKWNFLLRKTRLNLPAGTTEIKNTISGRILYVLIDGEKYNYNEDVEPFLTSKINGKVYSEFSDNLLFPKFNEDKVVEVIYYTNNSVIDENGKEKQEFQLLNDKSLIPMPFAEQILVYGACLRLKANPQYVKFPYWMGMYKEAIMNLKSKSSVSVLASPVIKLSRR